MLRFNGATARRPWKAVRLGGCGCRMRGFNGATARRPWKAAAVLETYARASSFNGATARRPWKEVRVHAEAAFDALQLQRGHGPEAVESQARQSDQAAGVGLQRGHGPEAVERIRVGIEVTAGEVASTGPRPGGRGKKRVHK